MKICFATRKHRIASFGGIISVFQLKEKLKETKIVSFKQMRSLRVAEIFLLIQTFFFHCNKSDGDEVKGNRNEVEISNG